MALKQLLPVVVVVLSTTLAFLTWYAVLMPFWAVQSGQKDSRVFYSQGMGLWLNYTEHVGDPDFDPGNSLWIPPQDTGVETYASQCENHRSFCANAIGDLHIQYCEVMDVYCGAGLKIMQVAMSILSGTALLAIVWSVVLVVTTRRTVVDYWLMQLCIFNGVGFLLVAAVWYFAFFRVVLSTTFYKDQYNRCSENPTNRSCWHIGTCVYLMVACAVLYPFESVVVATFEAQKFKTYKRKLRKLLDMTTAVDLPLENSPLDTRGERIQGGNATAMEKKAARGPSRGGTELQTTDTSRSLKPLQRVPSAVKAIDVHQIEGIQVTSDGEEEKEREDAVKYGQSREFVATSPSQARRNSLGSPTTAAAAESKSPRRRYSSSEGDRRVLKNIKSIEF